MWFFYFYFFFIRLSPLCVCGCVNFGPWESKHRLTYSSCHNWPLPTDWGIDMFFQVSACCASWKLRVLVRLTYCSPVECRSAGCVVNTVSAATQQTRSRRIHLAIVLHLQLTCTLSRSSKTWKAILTKTLLIKHFEQYHGKDVSADMISISRPQCHTAAHFQEVQMVFQSIWWVNLPVASG